MLEKTQPKDTDRQIVFNARRLIIEVIKEHPEIEPTFWASALVSLFGSILVTCEVSKQDITQAIDVLKDEVLRGLEKAEKEKQESKE